MHKSNVRGRWGALLFFSVTRKRRFNSRHFVTRWQKHTRTPKQRVNCFYPAKHSSAVQCRGSSINASTIGLSIISAHFVDIIPRFSHATGWLLESIWNILTNLQTLLRLRRGKILCIGGTTALITGLEERGKDYQKLLLQFCYSILDIERKKMDSKGEKESSNAQPFFRR